jgi:hypothetical protein
MDAHKVVMRHVERDGGGVVLDLRGFQSLESD